jgi:TrmH family RNA methyltransferase
MGIICKLAKKFMLSLSDIKLINALKQNKARRKMGLFVVEGPKMIEELLKAPNYEIVFIAASNKWFEAHQLPKGIKQKEITDKALQKLSSFTTANEVIAVVKIPAIKDAVFSEGSLYLVLDKLQDPGNLGTIIRTAEWFGIRHIICSRDSVDCYNPKVVQATMGSIFRVHCTYTDLIPYLETQTAPIYGALLHGKNIYTSPLKNSGFIVIGNESQGISNAVQKLITHPIYIPSYGNSEAESLNASIATAVICAEFRRN